MKITTITLYIPSLERDGATPVNQRQWTGKALAFFGLTFGGATAFPPAKGVWRDDDRGGVLVYDTTVMVQCHADPALEQALRRKLMEFCERMKRETNQSEVGLVIGDEYFGI